MISSWHTATKKALSVSYTKPFLQPKFPYSKFSTTKMSTSNLEKHLAPKEQPVFALDAKNAFEKLTQNEKKYAHYISQACWHGSKTCLTQTSEESPVLFELFQKLFHDNSDLKGFEKVCIDKGVPAEDFKDFVQFAAGFYGNLGNYLSFGDTKIIPRVSKDSFSKILQASKDGESKSDIVSLFEKVKDQVYNSDSKVLTLGLGNDGISTYYSPNVVPTDVPIVREYMQSKGISPYNTRLWKHSDKSYEIKTASGSTDFKSTTETFKGVEISVTYGDHAPYMRKIAENMTEALKYASNENQKKMIEAYVKTFDKGSIEDHKTAQRYWIKDQGPVVEHNIGFIESYRDPEGERGEFEGFVAMVNKETSKKFAYLVENAERFLGELPWPKEFEKDKFLRPDFTSLEVLTFASSGIPAGINIPNYDDIRQSEGFKNVSLGNVLSAKAKDPADYVQQSDQELYDKLETEAFEVQVGIHELLGHGSGKLLMQDKDGKFNFDDKNLKNPITGKLIESFYKSGESWDSKFQAYASTMEECRAEAIGIYLSLNQELLAIFGHKDEKEAKDITYINWLSMCRAGVRALEFYTPELKKWGQAHMQARFAILQVLLKAGGIVEIKQEKDNATVVLNRDSIYTKGKSAIGEFLNKLQVYKATADVEGGVKFYQEYCTVSDDYLSLREIILKKKKPRRVFVQAHTYLDANGEVQLKEFEPTPEGLIQSFVTRFGKNLAE